MPIRIGAGPLTLHAERAVELPDERALVIADVHWGKATALRAHGVPVPAGSTEHDLLRLDRVLDRTRAAHLIVVGDLAHSRHGWDARALAPVLAWRARRPALGITLVRGNHDAHAGDPPPALGIRAVDGPFLVGPFRCIHEPPAADGGAFTLAGHLHPAVTLSGRGRDHVRLPCFVVGRERLVLPAFSAFTGGGGWEPAAGDRVFAVVESGVVKVRG